MGSTESTGRSNGTEEEEERQPENDGGSMGAGTAVAIAAAGTVMAAWGIFRMMSAGSSDSEKKEKDDLMKIKAHGMESSSASFGIRESIHEYEGKKKEVKSIWSPPPIGRFKMNTDGGCFKGLGGYAGILRNHRGIWVRGFQGSFNGETTDALTAEFHGIHKGLKLLDKLQLNGSILESDCKAAVEWVKRRDDYRGTSSIISGCWDIIKESRQLILKNNIDVEHIPGEDANQCADKLAGLAVKNQRQYKEIEHLPKKLNRLVDKDIKSLMYH